MTRPYKLGIAQFVEHFRAQGAAIAEVPGDLHRKLLYCSAFDPLTLALVGRVGRQRDRYVDLLTHHTEWKDASRVSAFHLSCLLREAGRTRYRLYRYLSRQLKQTPPRRRLRLHLSPTQAELLALVATPAEERAVRSHTYANLFYNFRNTLVHQYREPGYGTDWSGREIEPFYTNQSSFGDRELVFPAGFIQALYEQALVGVEAELLRRKVNPHTWFKYGSYWRSE